MGVPMSPDLVPIRTTVNSLNIPVVPIDATAFPGFTSQTREQANSPGASIFSLHLYIRSFDHIAPPIDLLVEVFGGLLDRAAKHHR